MEAGFHVWVLPQEEYEIRNKNLSAWLRSWASLMRPSAQPTVSFITYRMVIPRNIPFA